MNDDCAPRAAAEVVASKIRPAGQLSRSDQCGFGG
jgi:hypothetical protein